MTLLPIIEVREGKLIKVNATYGISMRVLHPLPLPSDVGFLPFYQNLICRTESSVLRESVDSPRCPSRRIPPVLCPARIANIAILLPAIQIHAIFHKLPTTLKLQVIDVGVGIFEHRKSGNCLSVDDIESRPSGMRVVSLDASMPHHSNSGIGSRWGVTISIG